MAIDGKVTENIIPSFKKIDSFLKEWNIGIVDQRKLFLTVANVLKENKRYGGKSSSGDGIASLLIYVYFLCRFIYCVSCEYFINEIHLLFVISARQRNPLNS